MPPSIKIVFEGFKGNQLTLRQRCGLPLPQQTCTHNWVRTQYSASLQSSVCHLIPDSLSPSQWQQPHCTAIVFLTAHQCTYAVHTSAIYIRKYRLGYIHSTMYVCMSAILYTYRLGYIHSTMYVCMSAILYTQGRLCTLNCGGESSDTDASTLHNVRN